MYVLYMHVHVLHPICTLEVSVSRVANELSICICRDNVVFSVAQEISRRKNQINHLYVFVAIKALTTERAQ